MRYKNTIEIVTKDIQEIEKLVDNFKNYSSIPSIELDLALSRLRNIYDILLMLKENKAEVSIADKVFFEDKEPAHKEGVSGVKEIAETEASAADRKRDIPEKGSLQEENEIPAPHVKPPAKKSNKAETVLGDTFRDKQAYVYEKLEGQSHKSDLTTKLQTSPIKSISGNIGVNDKFLFIRELFNGNAGEFRETIDVLDNSHNFNEAYNYIIEHFQWEMESDTVQQLLNLIRRKFISREDE